MESIQAPPALGRRAGQDHPHAPAVGGPRRAVTGPPPGTVEAHRSPTTPSPPPDPPVRVPASTEREQHNARWTADLARPGTARERAADALYAYLLRAARSEIARRADTSRLSGPERDDVTHQAAADALVSVLRRLPDFRGDSLFTTWARSFVVFEVRAKVRQHHRRSLSQGLTAEEWDHLPSPRADTPAAEAEAVELRHAVMSAVVTSLTDRQRHVLLGVVVHGASVEQLAAQLGSNRNAIHQLMFHARRNLRRHLAERGFVHGAPGV